MSSRLAIKVDVDTDRGTREGVLPLAEICRRHDAPATFLFSLGPDNTGKAIRRVFHPGFLSKVTRTSVAGNYGLRTLLNGTLLPAPHIGRRNEAVMRSVRDLGFEVGIHCHDHFRWQDYLHRMSLEQIRSEFQQAVAEFTRIFGVAPTTAGAPGWQCNPRSLQVYDEAGLAYASDVRGYAPFLPEMDGATFKTPQVPSTLPTLDELIGRPEYPEDQIVDHYLALIAKPGDHVITIHAEIEGLRYAPLFDELLTRAAAAGVTFVPCSSLLTGPPPVAPISLAEIDGRSGTLAVQGPLRCAEAVPS